MSLVTQELSREYDGTEFSIPRNAAFVPGMHVNTLVTVAIELELPITGGGAFAIGDEYLLQIYDTINSVTKVVHRQVITALTAFGSSGTFKLMTEVYGPGWDVTLKKLAGANRTIGSKLTIGTASSLAEIADAVLDAAQVDHDDPGSIGAAIGDAAAGGGGGGGDATAANQAIIIGHVDTIEGALATVVGHVDTLEASMTTALAGIAAVNAETDNIQSRLPAALEGGNLPVVVKSIDVAAIAAIFARAVNGAVTAEEALGDLWAVLCDDATGLGTDAPSFGARVNHVLTNAGATRTRQ